MCHAANFILHLVARHIEWLSSSSNSYQSHFSVNVCHVFYLKAYLWYAKPFIKMSDGSWFSSLFLGNHRQHMQVCDKMIYSCVRKVLCIARTHMSLGTLGWWSICSFGGWCPSCRQVVGPKFVLLPETILWYIILPQISMLSWFLVSRQLVSKCQTLTYLKSYGYVGWLDHISP